MQQYLSFVNPDFSTHVYKLKQVLYSLKQALRAWFSEFCIKLLSLGFHESKLDYSWFIF